MPTIITDETDFASVRAILQQFDEQDVVNVYSSGLSSIEQTIAMGELEISDVIIQPNNDRLLIVPNSETIIERKISQLATLPSKSNLVETSSAQVILFYN